LRSKIVRERRPSLQALDGYKIRLRSGIERTNRRLATYEARYGVDTARFLREMTAEDLGLDRDSSRRFTGRLELGCQR
jgi:hypothetical protein